MYADDTTLSSTIDSFSDITSNTNADSLINAEIFKVIEWLKINKLSLNKTKSKYTTFHMPKKEIQHLALKIDGVNIEKVEEFNFLISLILCNSDIIFRIMFIIKLQTSCGALVTL